MEFGIVKTKSSDAAESTEVNQRVVICGPPNVGKSLLFNGLTSTYVVVSNYPGTTVSISSARSTIVPGAEIIDTPGAYSLLALSEEERVARDMLLAVGDETVLHVVDAKSLRRMLPMTLELLELNLRVVLVLNMMDEARRLDVDIDVPRLSELLGIPVVQTVATTREGLTDLGRIISDGSPERAGINVQYPGDVLDKLEEIAPGSGASSPTAVLARLEAQEACNPDLAQLELAIRRARQQHADNILSYCATFPPANESGITRALSILTLNPLTAIPLAFAVLYFGVYKFVGTFGAGTVVDFLEDGVYNRFITPWLTAHVEALLPWKSLQDLFVHDYGVLTLGLRYAIALVLPIVGTFFLLFSVLEDSGYLPRLALLLDRVFKKMGLNGRAVIPIVLGFGCGTMATVVTRILETRRERVIATLLLGVAIPCSAQLGVILAMLAGKPGAFVAWCVVVGVIFLMVGMIAARKLPGEIPSFYLELPALRMPRIGNVLMKTYSRMHWYFLEILPMFLAASVVIWLGHLTGLFTKVISLIEPVVRAMGLPVSAAGSFLFGFFRRDYGAAGLFDLQRDNLLDTRQAFVSVLVITLFLPCIAQFFVMKKERGWRFALATSGSILVAATIVGIAANYVLQFTGWLG